MMMYGWDDYVFYNGYWWMGLIYLVIQILLWSGLIYLGVYLFQRLSKKEQLNKRKDALDILRERYARGEIKTEEYNYCRDILQKE